MTITVQWRGLAQNQDHAKQWSCRYQGDLANVAIDELHQSRGWSRIHKVATPQIYAKWEDYNQSGKAKSKKLLAHQKEFINLKLTIKSDFVLAPSTLPTANISHDRR